MSTEILEAPQMAVAKLNITDTEIAKLKELYLPLKINGIEDKAGLKAVYEARQVVKKTRVGVEKYAKEMKETAIAWQKKVNAEQSRVVGELESIESYLQAQEDAIAEAKEQIRLEEEAKEKARIQLRIDKLAEFGFAIDYTTIMSIDDETFAGVLNNAKSEHEKALAAKAEEERKAREEKERLERERKELEDLRRQQAEAQRIIDENNARIRKEQEAKEAAIRAEQEKIEAQKRKVEQEKAEAEAAKKRAAELEKAKAQAAEDARLKAIADAKKEAEEKAEAERLEKLESERQAALRPDKEKLQSFSDSLSDLKLPTVSNEKAKAIVNDIQLMINKMQAHIIKNIKSL